ncbi:MAG: hypothetical protein ABJC87_01210 [Roseobacter sp.]
MDTVTPHDALLSEELYSRPLSTIGVVNLVDVEGYTKDIGGKTHGRVLCGYRQDIRANHIYKLVTFNSVESWNYLFMETPSQ